jgi:MFS transporter, CP family, cyanate transporter
VSTPIVQQARPVPRTGLLLFAVLLAGLNLRGAIAAVAPVLPEMRADLGLSPTVAGLLTTLPVLCFAALAPPAAWLGRRIGPERAVVVGLAALAAGTVLRALGGAPVLLVGTFVVGAGMTVGNVLLPAVIKRDFAGRAGTVTGLYTGALAAGAALTAGLTAPVAALGGWRWGLAVWALLAVATAALWLAVPRAAPAPRVVAPAAAPAGEPPSGVRVWRSLTAWAVAVVLGLQCVVFYAMTAWLPTLLIDEAGADLAAAALAVTLFHVLGIPGTLIVPAVLARRRPERGQSGLGLAVAATWGVLFAGLLVAPGAWPVWAVLGGLAQGAGVSLAFTLVVLRAADEDAVRRLSSMCQLVGYSVGAAGAPAVGALNAVSGGWTAPLVLLLVATAVLAAALVVGGRPRTIGGPVVSSVERAVPGRR